MNWTDIAMLMMSATFANHMGLVEAIEKVIRHKLPIVNCSKCCTFWLTLCYTILNGVPVISSVAISFLSAYVAVWYELLLGLIDNIYNKVYENSFASKTADTENS